MLLAVLALGAGALASRLAGGRLGAVKDVDLRWVAALLVGAALELAAGILAGPFGMAVLVAGYVLLVGFAVANIRVTGMVLVAAGLLANATVIALNGGMPVRGVHPGVALDPRHHGERPSDRITGLADVIHVGPVAETVSGGDIVLCLGAATVTWTLTRPDRRRGSRRPQPAS
jgi:Family of unknown function (DUF5317)